MTRPLEQVSLGEAPVTGFGSHVVAAPLTPAPGPWQVAIATSVLGAMTGWVLDEVSQRVRKRRK